MYYGIKLLFLFFYNVGQKGHFFSQKKDHFI